MLLGCLAFRPGIASAADTPRIKVDKSGPSAALPLREEFYLTGETEADVEHVNVVFVRYRYGPLGIMPRRTGAPGQRRANSCSEVEKALPIENLSETNIQASGVYKVGQLWPKGPDSGKHKTFYERLDDSQHRAFVAPQWVRSDADLDKTKKKATWSVLVKNKSFFRPGARYCLFVFKTATKSISQPQIDKLLAGYAQVLNTCLDEKEGTFTSCADMATASVATAIDAAIKDPELAKRAKNALAVGASDRPLGAVNDWARTVRDLTQVVDAWAAARLPARVRNRQLVSGTSGNLATFGAAEIELTAGSNPEPLAELILLSLRGKGKVRRNGSSYTASGSVKFHSPDGKSHILDRSVTIDEVFIVFDARGQSKRIELRGTAQAKVGGKELTTPFLQDAGHLANLDMPAGGTGLSLEELLQFLGGRILAPDGKYIPVEGILRKYPKLANALPTESNEDARALADAALRLQGAFASLGDVHAGRASTDHAGALAKLVKAVDPFTPCETLAKTKFPGVAEGHCTNNREDGRTTGSWPGFAEEFSNLGASQPTRNPLVALAASLDDLATASQAWRDSAGAATRMALRDSTIVTLASVPVQLDMTLDRFTSTYLTEVTGLAFLPGQADTATTIVGLQLFLYPNEVDEPMWVNGALDVRRIFGLQLAVRPNGQAYGPSARYGALAGSAIPPIFLGPVVQLIPYTTISAGAAFFGYRRTPLAAERVRTRTSLYISATAQLNVAAIIRRLASGQATATTTSTD